MKVLKRVLKRGIDVVLSIVLLLVTSPLLLLIAVVIRLNSVGPALFRQTRIGKDGKCFSILKFRTMIKNAPDIRNADNTTFNSDDDPRLTNIGKLLRNTSCDELPQLVNVLRGEMSLVGPRPELPEGVSSYTESQSARLKVRPGITGLAAIRGRNDLAVSVRRDLDAYYAENWTFLLDLQIMMQTIAIVLLGRGVNRTPKDDVHPSSGQKV